MSRSAGAESAALAWDQAALGWNRHGPLIHDWLRASTQTMLDKARIEKGHRVLDIAAGAGDQTLAIAERVGPRGFVLATDVSPAILGFAKENAARAGFSQVSTRLADAQSLNMAGLDFDAAVCRLGLMFCPSVQSALRQIHRALKPKGCFSALVFSEPARNPCIAITMACVQKHVARDKRVTVLPSDPYAPGSLMSLGKPSLMEALLLEAGYVQTRVQRIDAPFYAPSIGAYIEFLKASASPVIEALAGLNANAQQEAWQDMTEQLSIFATANIWIGPNELVLASASVP
jgi:SAM-dependent methyltransferase